MKVGETIKMLRQLNRLTLMDMEKKAGLHRAYISQIEHDRVKWSFLKTMKKLAKAFDCDPAIIIFFMIFREKELEGCGLEEVAKKLWNKLAKETIKFDM